MTDRRLSDNPEGEKPQDAPTGQGPQSCSVYWKLDGKDQAPAIKAAKARDLIGHYRLQQLLGEGGMGQVYLAEQTEPVKRTVALKLIRRGMDTREVVARFESERQVLALMSHPSIARVFDAGTAEDGSPYFVMEYVPGAPITAYCREHQLGTRARLKLFQRVCEAIHHAHQKAIIHRDIKPSNVLVTEIDGAPLPKVIDFGIAKATGPSSLDTTALTALGQLIGTPEYMSPEQAGLNELDIDTRTDIYSLGVLLYELLTGVLPFDPKKLRQGGHASLLRTICEEVPPRPSTRVRLLCDSQGGAAHAATGLSARAKELRGDLDWVTMKALEKDRARRYSSAFELNEDVRRHLSHEPVLAGPPSTFYRLRKLARKHREKVIAAAVLILLLAIFVLGSSIRERQQARALLRKGEASATGFAELLVDRQQIARGLSKLKEDLPAWLPLWERKDESELLARQASIKIRLDQLYFEALECFEQSAQIAPAGSTMALEAQRAKEDLTWRQRNEAEENDRVELSEGFFRRQIESMGLGTYAKELEGKGEVAIETDPPGAEVFCFRYEEVERRLLPLPFDPAVGLDDPPKGLVGGPLLRIERVWGPKGEPFRAGDRLLRVNDQETPTASALAEALTTVAADQKVPVEVVREGAAARLDWKPFPAAFYTGFKELKSGRLVDIRFQLDLTFEGYPLDFPPRSRLGVTDPASALRAFLPRGSYLLVVRKPGYAEARVPILIPSGPKPPRVQLFKIEEVPPGFVHIPAGGFTAGGDLEAYEALSRARENVNDFFMARGEVTLGEYLEFLNDKAARGELQPNGSASRQADWESASLRPFLRVDEKDDSTGLKPEIRGARLQPVQMDSSGRSFTLSNAEMSESPVTGISMMAAVEYAHWLSLRHGNRWRFRLPSSLEWEKAARGVDRRLYVWGNHSVWSYAKLGRGFVSDRCDREFTEARLSYPMDESVYGIRDLAGGAAEPTTSLALKDRQWFVYRGGYWISTDPRDHRVTSRNRTIPWSPQNHIGIRLVADPR